MSMGSEEGSVGWICEEEHGRAPSTTSSPSDEDLVALELFSELGLLL